MTNTQFSDLSFNTFNTSHPTEYSYTYITNSFTNENGNLYPALQNTDWNLLKNWMNKTNNYSKPPSLNEFLENSLYTNIHISEPFTNENGNLYPTPQNQDWRLLLNWINQIEPYQKPPIPETLYDYVVIGGGASGIMTSYKIATENPNKSILILESNENTLDDYKNSGYDNIFEWRNAQQDDNYQYAFVGENNETIWLGKGLGGGTLHFGLQYIDQADLVNAQFQEDISIYQNIANITNAQKYDYTNTNGVKKPNTAYYDLKDTIDASSNELNMNFYNNKVYSNDLQTNNRLLLGDLLQDLSNVTILYNQKISNIEFYNDTATNVINFNNENYYGKEFILCAGAIQTPAILQRSGIDCGNKLYDHGGFTITYGKLQPQQTTTTQPYSGNGDFQLNTANLEKINIHSNRSVYYATGNGVNSNDVNKVYDFTNWASSHPGGSYAITKWSTNYNLQYPHNLSRWDSYKSNFIEIGTYEGTINYANLPENLKSQALYDSLFPDETTTTTTYVPVDLGFESQNIISHVQTRDANLNWQTYYSIIPGLENTLILTHALSNSLTGLGSVKINSSDDVNPDVTINYLGNNETTYIDYLEEAFTKNHQLLTQQGYTLLQPAYSNLDTSEKVRAYIVSQINSIYHYHGSCAIGDVVDNNQKLYNKSNVYIGDISVLNKPWSGSTSVAALASGYKCALNFTNTTPETENSFYVSNSGNNLTTTTGTISDPFNTISYALSKITDQTKLEIREGSYEFLETNVSDPIEITSYNNEKVIFDGTRSIEDLKDSSSEGNWTPINRTIITDNNQQNTVTQYKIKLRDDVEIWQLFYNRKEVINARWPSAQWENDEVYDLNNWGHGYYNYSEVENTVRDYTNGEIVDISHNNLCLYSFVKMQKLIDSNFTLNDSLINLNIGSFKSYTKEVTNTILDDANNFIRLSYDPVDLYKEKHHYYYLENKLEYLNSQNEWYFDNTSKYLYVWLPNNSLPTTENIRAKVQSYSLNLKSDNITVSNINFFSTTVKTSGKDGITIDNCNFLYPSCYAHMLKQINYGSTFNPQQNETFISQTYMPNCSNCVIKNCVFKYTDGSVLEVGGSGNTLNNNYFSYIDKTVCNLSSVMTAIRYNGSNHTIKYNTIHKTGASSTLNPGNNPVIEYNNLYNSGYLQSDGAMIHLMVNQQVNSKIRFNWVHDTIKYGIRFDGDGDGHDGYIHHNIGWNCNGGIMAKGGILDTSGNSVGGHYVYNNTFFDSDGKNDLMILNTQAGNNINYGSLVLNNLAEAISGHRSNEEAFEPRITSLNNFSPSNMEDYLRNTVYHDYRPINNSSIVNSGLSSHIATGFKPNGVDILTTDIGAMRYSDSKWKAGITWNKSIYSDEEYVNIFRLNFFQEPEPEPEPEPIITSAIMVQGVVPNWLQPTSYGAIMGGYESQYIAWCSPTTAANQLGYLIDFGGLNIPNINDNIVAGNEKPFSTSISTIPWDSNNGWGDYLLDGPSHRGNLNKVSDFGWYMNTNNLGSSGAAANSPIGTKIGNIYTGMNKFYNEFGWYNIVSMSYNKVAPNFIGTPNEYPEYWKMNGYPSSVSLDRELMFETIKHEINHNRTVFACFQGWNIVQNSYADINIYDQESYSATYYKFGTFTSSNESTGEQYTEQIDNGEYGDILGHSVLIIGIIERGTTDDPEGNTDWLIVRDNQQNTARNVIIPYQNMATQVYPGWDKLLALLYVNINNGYYNLVSQPEPEPEPEPVQTFITPELISQYENLTVSEKTDIQISGTVQYVDLEGGFYGVVGNNAPNYLPINIQNELVNYLNQNIQINGYIQTDAVSSFMWGQLFYSINIIQTEPIYSIQKILCLHGGGDSVIGFSNQTGMQNMISDLDGEYSFDFLSASGNNMIDGVWWNDAPSSGNEKGTTTDENWAQTTIDKINNKIINDGPYHAILGYSQGAAASIVWDAFNRESASPLSISKVLLFCGYLPENHTGLINVIDRNSPSDTRTLIFIGDQDTNFKTLGLEIKNKFYNYLELIDSNVGHYTPTRTDETYNSVLSFIREETSQLSYLTNNIDFVSEPEVDSELFTIISTEDQSHSFYIQGTLTESSYTEFINKEDIINVSIGKGVTTIDNYAFKNCTNLNELNLPESLTEIGENAFENCLSLLSVTLPINLTNIGDLAFYKCNSMRIITFLNNNINIGENAFLDTPRNRVTILIPSEPFIYNNKDIYEGAQQELLGTKGDIYLVGLLPQTEIILSKTSFNESEQVGYTIGTFTTFSPLISGSHTYTNNINTDKVIINGNKLQTNMMFDYEKLQSFDINVTSINSYNETVTNKFTIHINLS